MAGTFTSLPIRLMQVLIIHYKYAMKKLCVYCGSSAGTLVEYVNSAKNLATYLVVNDIELIYGGASVGIMGVLAQTMLDGGGRVTGVMPKALVDKEIAHTSLSQLHVVNSMHERKSLMAELADGFMALPGGMGTLEELFEMLTWSQLGYHQKPCAALNVAGYFNGLLRFLDHMQTQGFIKPVHRQLLLLDESPTALVQKMLAYTPAKVDKWIRADDK